MDTQRTYPEGVPSWVELEQPDLAAAQAFYGGLFGWDFEVVGGGQYVIARLDGQDVAGLASPDPAQPGDGWTTYVAVDDAGAAASRVTAAGGRVVVPPAGVGPAGHMVVAEDPAGARFRLWQAGARLGAQRVNQDGTWNFSNLRGADAADVRDFYAAVFGWEYDDAGFAVLARRPGYADHLVATVDPGLHERQAAVSAPPGFADTVAWFEPGTPPPAHWHVVFSVLDRDRAAATAERLGGTVLSTEDSAWTRTALVRDPQGAALTVSQFAPGG
jgi:predicted enzyme related to lactoylglutathione lyase